MFVQEVPCGRLVLFAGLSWSKEFEEVQKKKKARIEEAKKYNKESLI